MPLRCLFCLTALVGCHAFAALGAVGETRWLCRAAKACHPGLLFFGTTYAATPPGVALPEQTRGDVTARLTVHVAESGPQPGTAIVRLTLTVAGGPLLQVEPAQLADPLNAWEARRNDWCRLDGDRLTWTESITLRQTKPGPAALPDVKVRFRDRPDAAWEEAEWVDIWKAPPDVPPPEFMPPLPSPMQWLPLMGVVVAAATLIVVGWEIARRFRPRPKPLPPEQWALRELARLDAGTAADSAAYHTALSDVVRRYLAEHFGLPATRQTTAEFLETVRRSGRLSAEQQALLRDFLERCDLAKFAPVGATAEDCREAAALARTFVEQTAGSLQGGAAARYREGKESPGQGRRSLRP